MFFNHRLAWRITSGIVFGLSLILFIALHQQYALCNSGVGELAQSLSSKAASDCSGTDALHFVFLALIIVSAITFAATFLRQKSLSSDSTE
jgi:drug/metabolite transporter (DMT)-like permease